MTDDKEKQDHCQAESRASESQEDMFQIEEIRIEEMAIDGICGVY